jgi:hypothetical protein
MRRLRLLLTILLLGCSGAPGSSTASSAPSATSGPAAGDATGVEEMGLDDGLALLGLYDAYMRDVQDEVYPRDALGNDEFDFFGAMG